MLNSLWPYVALSVTVSWCVFNALLQIWTPIIAAQLPLYSIIVVVVVVVKPIHSNLVCITYYNNNTLFFVPFWDNISLISFWLSSHSSDEYVTLCYNDRPKAGGNPPLTPRQIDLSNMTLRVWKQNTGTLFMPVSPVSPLWWRHLLTWAHNMPLAPSLNALPLFALNNTHI